MLKRTLIMFLALIVSVVLMTSCSKSDKGNSEETPALEKVNLTFWDENAGPIQTAVFKELISRFEKENSNITVEYVGLPQETAKQKYDTAIATKTTPDVGSVPQTWFSNFIANDALLQLDPYFDDWDQKDKLSANYVNANRSIASDGKLYNLPYTDTTAVSWYRSDWYKEADLSEPKTFDELFSNIAKMTNKDKNVYGFSLRGGAGSSLDLEDYLFAYSGISENFTPEGKSNMNLPIHLEALNKFVDTYKKYTAEGDVGNGYKEMVAAFDSGAAAMILHNQGSYTDHKNTLGDDKFQAALFPKGMNGKRTFTGGSANGYSIFKNTEHPKEAWKFISFLVSADSDSYWNEKIGQMPTNLDVIDYDWVKNAQYIQIGLNALNDADTVIRMRPIYLPEYSSIHEQILEPAFQKVLLNRMTTKEFLDLWAQSLEKAQADFMNSQKK